MGDTPDAFWCNESKITGCCFSHSLLNRKVNKQRGLNLFRLVSSKFQTSFHRLPLLIEVFLKYFMKKLRHKSAHVFYFAEGKRWCRGRSDENWLHGFKMHQGSEDSFFQPSRFKCFVKGKNLATRFQLAKKYRKENSCSIIIMFSSRQWETEKMMLEKNLKKLKMTNERMSC